eukprot:Phypoly_transcript_01221.p1 GENE.Phypoly_transcript_01221~~Phypoly_transcript_01221.p1  ORF type:complete len:1144 (-),score=203.04 Phypoly_transcript_01221:57-3488(-)
MLHGCHQLKSLCAGACSRAIVRTRAITCTSAVEFPRAIAFTCAIATRTHVRNQRESVSGHIGEAIQALHVRKAEYSKHPDPRVAVGLIADYGWRIARDMREVYSVYQDLRSHGRVDMQVYITVFRACMENKAANIALVVWNDLVQSGLVPPLPRDIALNLLTSISNSHRSMEVLKCCDSIASYGQDSSLAAALAKTYANHDAKDKALSILRAIPAHAIASAKPFAICTIMRVCALLGTPNAAQVGKSVFDKCNGEKRSDAEVASAAIQMHTKCGEPHRGIEIWDEWRKTGGGRANENLYIAILSACASLGRTSLQIGKQVHAEIVANGIFETCNIQLVNTILNMYAKCGEPQMALNTLTSINRPLDKFTYSTALRACAKIGASALHSVASLHARIRNENVALDDVLLNSLLSAYTKCGDPSSALKLGREVINNHRSAKPLSATTYTCVLSAAAGVGGTQALEVGKDIFSKVGHLSDIKLTSALINMFAKCGHPEESLKIWQLARTQGMDNSVMCISVLTACKTIGLAAKDVVERIRADYRTVARGRTDASVVRSLMRYYAVVGDAAAARGVWDEFLEGTQEVEVNSRVCLLNIYIELAQPKEAIEVWEKWRKMGKGYDDRVTLISVLTACANVGAPALAVGRTVHALVDDSPFATDIVLVTALMNMYCKCGDPRQIFPLWDKMRGISKYNSVTCLCVLTACAVLGTPAALDVGKQVHSLLDERKDIEVGVALMTALVNMYAKCGTPEIAVSVWRDMTSRGVPSNENTYITLLAAFATMPTRTEESMAMGRRVSQWMQGEGAEHSVALETALLNMYAKSGEIDHAERVFARITERRGVPHLECWTVMLGAYGSMLEGEKAVRLFEQMLDTGVQPDEVCFTALLAACADSGRVDLARNYLKIMQEKFSITPTSEHYCCIVNGLGRKGNLDEAYALYKSLNGNYPIIGMAILGACRLHKNVEIAEKVAEELLTQEPTNSGIYVVLGNTYAAAGMHTKAEETRKLMTSIGVKKEPGVSWTVDSQGKSHTFYAGEQHHPRMADIMQKWNELSALINYTPQLDWVLQNESDEAKRLRLCMHSEKLALCFALCELPADKHIFIFKNLRMCGDCHSATAIISKIINRTVYVRDARIFHKFSNGECTCKGVY